MHNKRLLIVDDQKFSIQLLRDIVGPSNFIVDEALDGATACRKAAEQQPDLILMDLLMPQMSGAEACRRLKQDNATSSIPIVVVTANKDKENLVEAFEAGADPHIHKPFTNHELLARINSNLLQ